MPFVALALLAVAAAVALAARRRLVIARAWAVIALASALVVAGHVATFLIAARTAGATAPLSQMLPLALLVLLAAALPNVGGWGPREGVDGVGVRRRRPGRVTRGRDRCRLWRDGVRRQPAGRRRPRGAGVPWRHGAPDG